MEGESPNDLDIASSASLVVDGEQGYQTMGLEGVQKIDKILQAPDGLLIDFKDHVSRLKTDMLKSSPRVKTYDDHALAGIEVEFLCLFRRHIPELYT